MIEANQTIEPIERFYADDVTMPNTARQENEKPPRVGKVVCLEYERRPLSDVATMSAKLLSQAINELTGVVFSEWKYESTDVLGRQFLLIELSVQHWRNNLIYKEKFYYHKVLTIS